jgi:hypothetical protein
VIGLLAKRGGGSRAPVAPLAAICKGSGLRSVHAPSKVGGADALANRGTAGAAPRAEAAAGAAGLAKEGGGGGTLREGGAIISSGVPESSIGGAIRIRQRSPSCTSLQSTNNVLQLWV